MRILDYFQFILEAKEEKLLPIILSDEFVQKMESIDSPIASKILELYKSKALSEFTFISSGDNEESVKYSDSSRFANFLDDENGWDLNTAQRILRTTKYSATSEYWQRQNVDIRVGRFIRKLFGTQFSDSEYEKFTNKFKSLKEEGFTFDLWEGWKIIEGYKSTNYDYEGSENNTLMNSCMNDALDCVEIYSYIKNLKLLVLLNEESHIVGRALIWVDKEGRKIMDRVYFTKDLYYYKFIKWAKQNDVWFKRRNVSGGSPFTKGDEDRSLKIKIEVPNIFKWRDSGYLFPYMDTFYFAWGTTISNFPPDDGNYIQLQQTDGDYEDHRNLYDVHGNSIDNLLEENYVRSITQGGLIWKEDSEFVNYNGGQGYPQYSFTDHIEISYLENPKNGFVKSNGKWYKQKHCVWSESEGQWIFRPDAIWKKTDWVSWDNFVPENNIYTYEDFKIRRV